MDIQFSSLSYTPPQIEHHYGSNIHILKNPLLLSLLARLCSKQTTQPEVSRLVVDLYRTLVYEVVAAEFPRDVVQIPTRMIDIVEQGIWQGEALQTKVSAIVVALARAGLLPSQITYDFLNHLLDPSGVRQDHLALSRTLDSQGKVTGTGLQSSKIGGSIEGSIVLIPDPMGATGSTVGQVLKHYQQAGHGTPHKILALHLIITPEYIRFLNTYYPHVIVYALRLDRGLSSSSVLQTIPGTHLEQEKGLTEKQYIVPGAGGLGEVLNNSYV